MDASSVESTMKAMVLKQVVERVDETSSPLTLVDLPKPAPGAGEILIQVLTCGVCHTELDEIEGRTAPPRFPVVPGHEVIGRVVAVGEDVHLHALSDRVGVGWIHYSTGEVEENLSADFVATGRDVNGGYAEFMTVHERYAYAIPDVFTDEQAAPLLCAGGIGYRSLKLSNIKDGEPLGLMGFGGSAHIVIQLIHAMYPNSGVYVFARKKETQEFAMSLGATWAGGLDDRPPTLLNAIIDTTPAWKPIVRAMWYLRPGGRLVINAIRKEDRDKDCLMELTYGDLWMEREIKSVANITRNDLIEFLRIAASIPIRSHVTTFELSEANAALCDLRHGKTHGANVLIVHKK